MNYNEALNFIEQSKSLCIKPGLSRIIDLLNILGNPQDKIKIIHIAGTNGKGTVAATIADALQKDGFKVGLFTSPWINDYREQIQINGKYITKNEFADIFEYFIKVSKGHISCTEFEILTAMMYWYFANENVDYAVIECGMGGTGDATNVEKTNVCSVLTSICLDHTDFLGNSLQDIISEKEGIIRKNSPCFRYVDTGNFCEDNLTLVNKVLSYIGCSKANFLSKLTARQEKVGNILIDGGHNSGAATALSNIIDNEIAVIGMMKDKDIDNYLSVIAPKCKKIICTNVSNPRAIDADELAVYAKKYCDDVEVVPNNKDAIKENGVSLVCGSFYLIREIINLIK